MNRIDRKYALIHKTKQLVYVGRTFKDIDARVNEHITELLSSMKVTKKLEYLRHEPENFEIHELPHDRSEAELMQEFKNSGYELLNSTGGNRATLKRHNIDSSWKEKPIFVAKSPTTVALKAITQLQYEEYKLLPDAEARYAYIKSLGR